MKRITFLMVQEWNVELVLLIKWETPRITSLTVARVARVARLMMDGDTKRDKRKKSKYGFGNKGEEELP